MPEIIDNVKVGLYIKQLLKERKMTQDDLADALSISKSAVSQNLNGKSTFDIQNLMQIAKLFQISLDDLLNLKSTPDANVLSEYEKVVVSGLEGIKKVSASDLRIQTPDLYGKVLIEYVIDRREKTMFSYLDDSGILFVEDFYHRAKEIYLRIIMFMLEENLEPVMKYLSKYAKLAGSLAIDDQVSAERIWRGIDASTNVRLIPDLFAAENQTEKKIMSFIPCRHAEKIMSRKAWLDVLSKYHLANVLKTYLALVNRPDDLASFAKAMLAGGYADAVAAALSGMSAVPGDVTRPVPPVAQEAIALIAESGETALFEMMMEKTLYSDLTDAVVRAVHKGKLAVFDAAFGSKPDALDYRRLGSAFMKVRGLDLLKRVMTRMKPDDFDYLLGETVKDDFATIAFLIEAGARFGVRYYRGDTFDKVNGLLHRMMKKERE